jgi:hypothetical protein
MTAKKKTWQEPVVKSIDQCQPIFGECQIGNSPTNDGTLQCMAGNGATTSGACTLGNGAKSSCTSGQGVTKK